MEHKATGRPKGRSPGKKDDSASSQGSVKVTLHLSVETAQRLGIESAMRRVSQSAIADQVLAAYLSRWTLPAATEPERLSVS
jgi:hypothetical protein